MAASLNDLGLVLMAQHKLTESEAADKEALAIRHRLFGDENADTATSINDLGAVYREEGRLAEAEALAREALGIRQRLFPSENLDVADSLRNLSIILGDEGKWAEAEAMAREVRRAMRRKRCLVPSMYGWRRRSMMLAWAAHANGKHWPGRRMACKGSRSSAMRQRKLLPDERSQRGRLSPHGRREHAGTGKIGRILFPPYRGSFDTTQGIG